MLRLFDALYRKLFPIRYWRKKGATIGNNCEIYSSAYLEEPYLISIGDHVRVNDGVEFVTHDGGVWVLRKDENDDIDLFGNIEVGNNVHIGTNAIIMPNVRIGNNCIIGCGAIVTKGIPDNSVAVGIPARVIETVEEYAEKNRDRFVHTKRLKKRDKELYIRSHMKVK